MTRSLTPMTRLRRTVAAPLLATAVLATAVGACAAPDEDGGRGAAPHKGDDTAVAAEHPRVTSDLRFRTDGYRPRSVPASQRPWNLAPDAPKRSLTRAAGKIPMFELNGREYEHPQRQSSAGLQDLAAWRSGDGKAYLERATRAADHLLDHRVASRGAWYFPYTFPYASNHLKRTDAPWYSAMAQGMALGLFTHLAQERALPHGERERYRTAADRTFDSLLLGPAAGKPWVSQVDKDGYLWLEEYPHKDPDKSDFTFNGHNFAAAGVWDYHQMTHDQRAAKLFDGALTTSAHYAPLLRKPGAPSRYCKSHVRRDSGYHGVVTRQLLEQYWLSGSKKHLRLHEIYLRDHVPSAAHKKDRWYTPSPGGDRATAAAQTS